MLGSGWRGWQCWGAQEEGETSRNWRRAQEGAGGLGEGFSRAPTCRFHWWKQARLSVWARSRAACLCRSWGESTQWAVCPGPEGTHTQSPQGRRRLQAHRHLLPPAGVVLDEAKGLLHRRRVPMALQFAQC